MKELRTVRITFRVRPSTLEQIQAIAHAEKNMWDKKGKVSSYLQKLIASDLKRRREESPTTSSDKTPAKRSKPFGVYKTRKK